MNICSDSSGILVSLTMQKLLNLIKIFVYLFLLQFSWPRVLEDSSFETREGKKRIKKQNLKGYGNSYSFPFCQFFFSIAR